MKRLNKKGFELTAIPQIVIVLVVSAILMGIGGQILSTMQDTSQIQATSGILTRANDTFTALFSTNVTFAPSSLNVDGDGKAYLIACSNVVLFNYSNRVHTTNFTVSGCAASLLNETLNNTEFGANYTISHYVYGAAFNNTQTGLEAQEDFSDWLPTFVVIMAGVVVIGLISKYLLMG